jgi:hypothetical protein
MPRSIWVFSLFNHFGSILGLLCSGNLPLGGHGLRDGFFRSGDVFDVALGTLLALLGL